MSAIFSRQTARVLMSQKALKYFCCVDTHCWLRLLLAALNCPDIEVLTWLGIDCVIVPGRQEGYLSRAADEKSQPETVERMNLRTIRCSAKTDCNKSESLSLYPATSSIISRSEKPRKKYNKPSNIKLIQ